MMNNASPSRRAAKRSNWLLVHRGGGVLRAADVNAQCEHPLVQECHSMMATGGATTTSFVHTVLQVHESSIRNAVRKALPADAAELLEVASFKNPRCAFQVESLRRMAQHFKTKGDMLVSTWLEEEEASSPSRRRRGGGAAGFFFGALVKKLDPALRYPPSSTEKRVELEERVLELEKERDMYKRKYEALAEQFLVARSGDGGEGLLL